MQRDENPPTKHQNHWISSRLDKFFISAKSFDTLFKIDHANLRQSISQF